MHFLGQNVFPRSIQEIFYINKVTSQMLHLENSSLTFSSLSCVICLNLPQSLLSLLYFGVFLATLTNIPLKNGLKHRDIAFVIDTVLRVKKCKLKANDSLQ